MLDDTTLSDQGWIRRSAGDNVRFENESDCLRGLYRGTREGLYGLLGVIDAEDGRKFFKMYASMQRQLDGVTDGTAVLIVYRGERRSRAGRDFKAFDVYTKEAEERPADGVEAPF